MLSTPKSVINVPDARSGPPTLSRKRRIAEMFAGKNDAAESGPRAAESSRVRRLDAAFSRSSPALASSHHMNDLGKRSLLVETPPLPPSAKALHSSTAFKTPTRRSTGVRRRPAPAAAAVTASCRPVPLCPLDDKHVVEENLSDDQKREAYWAADTSDEEDEDEDEDEDDTSTKKATKKKDVDPSFRIMHPPPLRRRRPRESVYMSGKQLKKLREVTEAVIFDLREGASSVVNAIAIDDDMGSVTLPSMISTSSSTSLSSSSSSSSSFSASLQAPSSSITRNHSFEELSFMKPWPATNKAAPLPADARRALREEDERLSELQQTMKISRRNSPSFSVFRRDSSHGDRESLSPPPSSM